jgi:hypothetical protein
VLLGSATPAPMDGTGPIDREAIAYITREPRRKSALDAFDGAAVKARRMPANKTTLASRVSRI